MNASLPSDDLRSAFDGHGAAWQLNQFAMNPVAFNPATSLFTVWLFPNDLFYAGQTGQLPGQLYPPPVQPDVISNGIANIVTLIQLLAAAGAEHFLVPNMPDLSDTPEFLGNPLMSGLSQQFNTYLALALTALDTALSDAEIVQFDTAAALKTLIANPGAYGLTNTTGACVYNPGSCDPTANTWLFWDGVHPTTRVHDILASMMYNAVPEPASLPLLVFGLLGVLVWRRGSLAGGRASRHRSAPAY